MIFRKEGICKVQNLKMIDYNLFADLLRVDGAILVLGSLIQMVLLFIIDFLLRALGVVWNGT